MSKLNQYQVNVIDYFNQHMDGFIEWMIKEKKDEKVVVDFLANGIKYLDKEIKAEMGLYRRKPYEINRYDYLSDILIEVNLAHKHKDFAEALTRKIAAVFAVST